MSFFRKFAHIDGWIMLSVSLIFAAGLITLRSFLPVENTATLFSRQLIFVCISYVVIIGGSFVNISYLKQSRVTILLYLLGLSLLGGLFLFGSRINGALSWYELGIISFQPADAMKLFLVLVLAKYLSARHVALGQIKHLLVTCIYMAVPFVLVLIQPDFGSAAVLALIWLGVCLTAGVSRKHFLALIAIGLVGFVGMWLFVFQPYQKARFTSFLNPLEDLQGTGYNAYQATIAVGGGQVLGKGVGFGTQSRLSFLPEHETDFIFASFSEEWGFVGATIILLSFSILLWRLILLASNLKSSYGSLLVIGTVMLFSVHILFNIGMNIGLLPVTGVPLPLMSYGGSHLIIESILLGLILSAKRTESVRVSGAELTAALKV